MTWPDVVILVLIGLSMLISLWRGFTREALSLVAWIVAFWVGFTFAIYPAEYLEPHVSVRLFLVTLLLGGVVNYLIGKAVDKAGMTGTDRMLGLFFGLARGVVMVAILVLLAGLTPLPQDPWWRESLFIGHFQQLAELLRDLLPPDIAAYFVYD